MRYFRKMVGEQVYLSPMNKDDTEIYTKWLNDRDVSSNLGNYKNIISLNNEQRALDNMTQDGHNYAIVYSKTDSLIGNISLMEIDHIGRKATVGLFIGDADNRGKGYGSEALKLILNYGFKYLNLHNIMLLVHADNNQAISCYKKVGFKEFGIRREATFINGHYLDVIYMEILDTDL